MKTTNASTSNTAITAPTATPAIAPPVRFLWAGAEVEVGDVMREAEVEVGDVTREAEVGVEGVVAVAVLELEVVSELEVVPTHQLELFAEEDSQTDWLLLKREPTANS